MKDCDYQQFHCLLSVLWKSNVTSISLCLYRNIYWLYRLVFESKYAVYKHCSVRIGKVWFLRKKKCSVCGSFEPSSVVMRIIVDVSNEPYAYGYLCIVCFVSFSVLFVCICVLYHCHWVATQLQLNISYHINTTEPNGSIPFMKSTFGWTHEHKDLWQRPWSDAWILLQPVRCITRGY